MKVGFVGLGTMGRPMAGNLLKAGFALRVYNRTIFKTESLVAAGAERVDSPSEVARAADVTITMLSDSPDVKEVILRDDGILAGARRGSVIVDMSTISPLVTREIASTCEANGVDFLDAPVTGGQSGAIAGTLSILVGGRQCVLERVRPVLEAMGNKITLMGPTGSGQIAKLCNQVVCGLNILAVCEGLALARASGIDLELLLDAISEGAASSWMLTNLAPKIVAEDWSPGFRIALQEKDLRLALQWAAENGAPLVATALAGQLFSAAKTLGWADEGTQALSKVVLAMGGR